MSEITAAIILAAGKGTRMRSERAKVLHPFLGRPMIAWIVEAALEAGFGRVVVLVGAQGDEVEAAVRAAFPEAPLAFARQPSQRGTGDAVRCALPAVGGAGRVAILSGDTPALDAGTLRRLRAARDEADAALVVTTFEAPDATGYGRIVRGADGGVLRIVEHADASPEERALREVNAGLYLAATGPLARAVAQLDADNAQGELYLTDAVAALAAEGARVVALPLDDPLAVAGINDRVQLAALEQALLARRRDALMRAGVTLVEPATVRIEAGVTVGADTEIGPSVQLLGATRIGRGCRIGQGAVLTDCALGDGVTLLPYVVATGARLGDGATAGPFAHLRPGTVLGARAKVGNFVETKQARLGPGSKASHLSYLGDCEIGRDVNIGAGTITCNYDGVDKHLTVIEDEVFIGSDTQLVAPVRVGRRATVGAGTTVTRDVPAGALALSRAPQREVEGYDERRRRPREEAKRRARAQAAGSDHRGEA